MRYLFCLKLMSQTCVLNELCWILAVSGEERIEKRRLNLLVNLLGLQSNIRTSRGYAVVIIQSINQSIKVQVRALRSEKRKKKDDLDGE